MAKTHKLKEKSINGCWYEVNARDEVELVPHVRDVSFPAARSRLDVSPGAPPAWAESRDASGESLNARARARIQTLT